MLFAAPTVLSAQASTDPPPPPWEWTTVGGLHFFGPTGASITLGGGLRRKGPAANDRVRLFFGAVEPGFGALRLSAGYAESIGPLASGWSLRSSLLQLLDPEGDPRYAGLEIQAIPLYCVGVRVGAFRSIETPGRKGTLWIADFSVCL
jgi:hypothetical protein